MDPHGYIFIAINNARGGGPEFPKRYWLGVKPLPVARPADFLIIQIDEKRQDVVANFKYLSVMPTGSLFVLGDDEAKAPHQLRSKDEISTNA